MISESEKSFIIAGAEMSMRNDGRELNEMRDFTVTTSVNKQSSGSCRLNLGGTDIICSIKVSVGDIVVAPIVMEGEMETDQITKGRIDCSVQCSPSAGTGLDWKQSEELCGYYASILNRILNMDGGIDLQSLVIIPNQVYWILNIELLILDYAGNMLDAMMMAIRGAIFDTRLAKVKVESADGAFDYDVAEDETETIAGRENAPISVSLWQIGKSRVIDPTAEEELCANARVIVFCNPKGKLSVQKDMHGAIEPSLFDDMVSTGKLIASKNLQILDELIRAEEKKKF